MITKAEVFQEMLNGEVAYIVYPSIKLKGYYKRTKNKIVCSNKAEVSETVWNILHNKVCPECGHIFAGKGWDGIESH